MYAPHKLSVWMFTLIHNIDRAPKLEDAPKRVRDNSTRAFLAGIIGKKRNRNAFHLSRQRLERGADLISGAGYKTLRADEDDRKLC